MLVNNHITHTNQDPEPAAKLAKLVLILAIAVPLYIGYKVIPRESFVVAEPTTVDFVEESVVELVADSAGKEVVVGERLGVVVVSGFADFAVERFMGQCNQSIINYLVFKKGNGQVAFALHDLNPSECLQTDNFIDPNGVGRSGNYFYDRASENFYNDYGPGKLQIIGQTVVIGNKSLMMYPLKYSNYEGYFIPLVEHNQSIVITLEGDSDGKAVIIDEVLKKISVKPLD